MSNEEMEAIYDEGHATAERGGKSAECPYAMGTEQRARWMLGFDDGGGDE